MTTVDLAENKGIWHTHMALQASTPKIFKPLVTFGRAICRPKIVEEGTGWYITCTVQLLLLIGSQAGDIGVNVRIVSFFLHVRVSQ